MDGSGALARVADQLRHVVVGPDVPDRPVDVRWTFPARGSFEDRRAEPGRAVLDGLGGLPEPGARLVVHAAQCLMFQFCDHVPILRAMFVVC